MTVQECANSLDYEERVDKFCLTAYIRTSNSIMAEVK